MSRNEAATLWGGLMAIVNPPLREQVGSTELVDSAPVMMKDGPLSSPTAQSPITSASEE